MARNRKLRIRTGFESVVAVVTGVLGLLTVFWHDWIEGLTGWDPDHHNGSAEWLIVAGLLAIAVLSAAAARRDWRLLTATG